ncbi:MAG: glycine--tRNA ligase [Crenarchaeota archaeon]|nr:glycine--tRNA ligase [Thermoproteota archaeon]
MSKDRSEVLMEYLLTRGFVWPSFEIYRSMVEVGGFYDYGPLGVEVKRNIVEKWRRIFVYPYQDIIFEIETPIIMPEIVFQASGHLEHFTDYIVECMKCGRKYRADHLVEEELKKRGINIRTEGLSERDIEKLIIEHEIKCPQCGGELSKVYKFNLLFRTTIGPYSNNVGYIRPETAQGMFVTFPRIFDLAGRKLPFGVAQIGRVGRNEISPRQGLIRLREFSQMEIELFFDPKDPRCPFLDDVRDVKIRLTTEDEVKKAVKEGRDPTPMELTPREIVDRKIVPNEWMAFYMALAMTFMNELGIPVDHQYFLAKLPEERAHYAACAFDQMVLSERFGWIEVSGLAYRTDYDLSRHEKFSGRELRAERRLDRPVEIEVVRVYPNPQKIREVFRDKAREVMKLIAGLREEDARRLARGEKIRIGEYEITPELVFLKVERKKITKEKFVPHVVEPSFGIDRIVYVTLEHAFTLVDSDKILLRLPPDIAPIKVAVLPLVRREPLTSIGASIARELARRGLKVLYDDDGSIGSRYSRCDELGVPIAVTVDDRTVEDGTVTLRDRDTRIQIRAKISDIYSIVRSVIEEKRDLVNVGRELGLEVIERT